MFSQFNNFIVNKINITYTFLTAIFLVLITIIAPVPATFIFGFQFAVITFFISTLLSAYMLFVIHQQFKRP